MAPAVDQVRLTGRQKLWLGLILLLTFGIHAPSIGNDFAFDDHFNVKARVGHTGRIHSVITGDHSLLDLFSMHYLEGSDHPSRGYRPLTVVSYVWTYRLFAGSPEKDTPMPHHALNVLLQTLNTWLVFLLVLAVCRRAPPALLAALVFGVHAVHSGPVASIVGRGELLAFAFGASAGLCFLRAVGGRTVPWLVAAGVMLFLSLCSKESSIAWVVLLPLLVLARQRSLPAGEPVRRVVLLSLLVAVVPVSVFVGLYWNATHEQPPFNPGLIGNPIFHLSLSARLASALLIWVYALGKVIVPYPLTCDYGHITQLPVADSLFEPLVLAALALLLALIVAGIAMARRRPLLFLAMATFFGFYFIVSNVPFGLETIFAERLLYTPSLGFSFLVAALALAWRGRLRRVGLVVLLVWCAGSSAMTVHRMFVWENNVTLFSRDLNQRPGAMRMITAMVGEMQQFGHAGPEGELKAIPYYEMALEQMPDFPLALINLGRHRMREGDKEGAMRLFQRGIESPVVAKHFRDDAASLYYHAGQVHQMDGREGEAIRHYLQAVELRPNYRKCYPFLVRLLLKRGDLRKAGDVLQVATRVLPQDLGVRLLTGLLAARRGDHRAAAHILQASLFPLMQQQSRLILPADGLVFLESLAAMGELQAARKGLAQWLTSMPRLSPDLKPRVDALRRRLAK